VAIGGIDARHLPWVLAVGFTNFAVVRAVCSRLDPQTAISELQATWRKLARQDG
jgi:thiamine monophosphate synthase